VSYRLDKAGTRPAMRPGTRPAMRPGTRPAMRPAMRPGTRPAMRPVRTHPLAPHWSGKCEACVGRSTKFWIFGSFCSCTRSDTVLHKGVSQRHPSNGRSGLLFGFLPPIAFLEGARVLPYLKRGCFHPLLFPSPMSASKSGMSAQGSCRSLCAVCIASAVA